MFDRIIDEYIMEFELQHSYFLRDCLEEEISYELKESNLIIYKKNNGISEEISLDELIFYIHTDVIKNIRDERTAYRAKKLQMHETGHKLPASERQKYWEKCEKYSGERCKITKVQGVFISMFKDIDTIKKAVENMKIILKYDKKFSEMKVLNMNENSECDEKNKDSQSPVF